MDEVIDLVMKPANTIATVFLDNIDLIASLSCVVSAFVCVALMLVILREKAPLIYLQRASLAVLAFTLFANGVTYYEDWQLIDGHRLTGAYLNIALMINVVVMLIRGGIIMQNGDKYGRRWNH